MIVPRLLRHHWMEQKKANGSTIYVCVDCKTWTANLPLYRKERCEGVTEAAVFHALAYLLGTKEGK